jgi:hypothetical protein
MTSPTSAMAKSALMKKFTDRKNKNFFLKKKDLRFKKDMKLELEENIHNSR